MPPSPSAARWPTDTSRARAASIAWCAISPFNAEGKRQTSFAAVDVSPEVNDDIDVELRDEDIREDVFRASGAGGQHVNKTSSAIRLTHLPTGIAVQCQNERSQHKNRAMAMKMLRARLARVEEEKREARAGGQVQPDAQGGLRLADPQLLPAPRPAREGRPHRLPGGQLPQRAGRQHPGLSGRLPGIQSAGKLAARHGGRSLYFNSVTWERPPCRSGRCANGTPRRAFPTGISPNLKRFGHFVNVDKMVQKVFT